MADIRLSDKWVVSSDAHGWQLSRIRNRQADGEEYTQSFAYFGSAEHAFTRILEQTLRDSESTDICLLLKELKEAKDFIAQHFMEAEVEKANAKEVAAEGFEVIAYDSADAPLIDFG
jgi:hypothetical protein